MGRKIIRQFSQTSHINLSIYCIYNQTNSAERKKEKFKTQINQPSVIQWKDDVSVNCFGNQRICGSVERFGRTAL